MFTTYNLRIYSIPEVIDPLADSLHFGTVIYGTGIWMGVRENSAIMDVVLDGMEVDRLIDRAHLLANESGESSILVTAYETNGALVTASGDRLPITGSIMETIK